MIKRGEVKQKDPFYLLVSRENSFWLKRLWHVRNLWYLKCQVYLGLYELLFTKERIFVMPQSVKTLVFNHVKTGICSFCVWQWSRIKQKRQFLMIEMNAVKFIKKTYGAPFDLLSILSLKLTFVPQNSLLPGHDITSAFPPNAGDILPWLMKFNIRPPLWRV